MNVVNNDYSSTSKPRLRFEETRNTPSLPGDSADYFCSIVRFNIQTVNTLPSFLLGMETGQRDINQTMHKVSFEYTATLNLSSGGNQKKLLTRNATVIH